MIYYLLIHSAHAAWHSTMLAAAGIVLTAVISSCEVRLRLNFLLAEFIGFHRRTQVQPLLGRLALDLAVVPCTPRGQCDGIEKTHGIGIAGRESDSQPFAQNQAERHRARP